jgi:hypothetical protein
MNLSNIVALVVLVVGGLMATGTLSQASSEPCTANDKLLDIIKDQQKKLSDILVADIQDANKAKQEALEARKKYDEKLEELKNKPCK